MLGLISQEMGSQLVDKNRKGRNEEAAWVADEGAEWKSTKWIIPKQDAATGVFSGSSRRRRTNTADSAKYEPRSCLQTPAGAVGESRDAIGNASAIAIFHLQPPGSGHIMVQGETVGVQLPTQTRPTRGESRRRCGSCVGSGDVVCIENAHLCGGRGARRLCKFNNNV